MFSDVINVLTSYFCGLSLCEVTYDWFCFPTVSSSALVCIPFNACLHVSSSRSPLLLITKLTVKICLCYDVMQSRISTGNPFFKGLFVVQVQLCNIADRVNLGLLPSSESGWQIACKVLKSTGGMLHVHGNVTSGIDKENIRTGLDNHNCKTDETVLCMGCKHILSCETSNRFLNETYKHSFGFDGDKLFIRNDSVSWKKVEWKVWAIHVSHSICSILWEVHKVPWRVSVLHLHHVKSYAPHIDHLVLDLHCEPFV